MDWEFARLGFEIFQFLFTLGVAAYAVVANRNRATRKRLEELRKSHGGRLDTHAERLTKMEAALPYLPTNKAINALAERIGDLNGEIKALHAEVSGLKDMRDMMSKQIELVDSFLRKKDA